MDPLYARYPFLGAAREAVEAAGVDLAAVADSEQPVVDRAVGRVRHAIEDGDVGREHRSNRVELLSYPLARVLVSLIDQPGLTRRYAHAEASTALDRFRADADEGTTLRSLDRPRLSRQELLDEFGLAAAVEEREGSYWVDVSTYLRLAGRLHGADWRLVGRVLAAGAVAVSRAELDELLRAAVLDRVQTGLPLEVPDAVAGKLDPAVTEIRGLLDELQLPDRLDAVVPELFPPCIVALLDRARGDEELAAHSRFALVSFLAAAGMEPGEIADRLDEEDGTVEYQVDHLRAETGDAAYPSPSCATMQAYGDCVDQDALCAEIHHPFSYYRRRLDGDDEVLQASRPESQ